MRHLAPLVGVPASTGNDWIRCGLVTPERRAAGAGRGGHTVGLVGLMELVAVARLREFGFPTTRIKRAVSALRELSGGGAAWGHLRLIARGPDLTWEQDEEHVISLLKAPYNHVLVLNVGSEFESLKRLLETEEGPAEATGRALVGTGGK
jgi:hypothetical protein